MKQIVKIPKKYGLILLGIILIVSNIFLLIIQNYEQKQSSLTEDKLIFDVYKEAKTEKEIKYLKKQKSLMSIPEQQIVALIGLHGFKSRKKYFHKQDPKLGIVTQDINTSILEKDIRQKLDALTKEEIEVIRKMLIKKIKFIYDMQINNPNTTVPPEITLENLQFKLILRKVIRTFQREQSIKIQK